MDKLVLCKNCGCRISLRRWRAKNGRIGMEKKAVHYEYDKYGGGHTRTYCDAHKCTKPEPELPVKHTKR